MRVGPTAADVDKIQMRAARRRHAAHGAADPRGRRRAADRREPDDRTATITARPRGGCATSSAACSSRTATSCRSPTPRPSSRCRRAAPGRSSAARSTTRRTWRVLLHRDAVLRRSELPDDLGARRRAAAVQRLRAARRRLHVDRRARRLGTLGRARVDEPVRRVGVDPRRVVRLARRDEPRLRLRRVLQHAAVPARARVRSRCRGTPTTSAQRRRDLRQRPLDGRRRRRPSTTARATRTTTTCSSARCSARASGITLTPFDEHAHHRERRAAHARARRRGVPARRRPSVRGCRPSARSRRSRARTFASSARASSTSASSTSSTHVYVARRAPLPAARRRSARHAVRPAVERRAEVARALLRRERRRGRRAKAGRSR